MRSTRYSALVLLGLAGCNRTADVPVAKEAIIAGLGKPSLCGDREA